MCTADHDSLRSTPALWATLAYVGIQIVEADDEFPAEFPAERLELRNCTCGSTLAIVLA